MTKRIGFYTSKGGGGKTTASLSVAAALAEKGKKVLYIDHDKDGSATDFFTNRAKLGFEAIPNLDFLSYSGADLHSWLPKQIDGKKYHYVIVDGAPGADSTHLRTEIAAVEHVVIPIQPAMADLQRARSVIAVIKEAQERGHAVKAYFMASRVIEGTRLSKGFLEALNSEGIPRLPAWFGNRVGFPEAASAYQTVLEFDPKGRAAEEARALAGNIEKMK